MVPQYWTHESGVSNIAVFFYFGYAFRSHQAFDDSSSDAVIFLLYKDSALLIIAFLFTVVNTAQDSRIDSAIAEIATNTHSAASDNFLAEKLAPAVKIY